MHKLKLNQISHPACLLGRETLGCLCFMEIKTLQSVLCKQQQKKIQGTAAPSVIVPPLRLSMRLGPTSTIKQIDHTTSTVKIYVIYKKWYFYWHIQKRIKLYTYNLSFVLK